MNSFRFYTPCFYFNLRKSFSTCSSFHKTVCGLVGWSPLHSPLIKCLFFYANLHPLQLKDYTACVRNKTLLFPFPCFFPFYVFYPVENKNWCFFHCCKKLDKSIPRVSSSEFHQNYFSIPFCALGSKSLHINLIVKCIYFVK